MMAEIEMYATQTCDYCADARTLFKKKGVTYKEIDVTGSKELRKEMTKRANGGDTVPQIFIDGKHIGGYDDMRAMDKKGLLDPLLGKTA
jgi:glutaredoxin 3